MPGLAHTGQVTEKLGSDVFLGAAGGMAVDVIGVHATPSPSESQLSALSGPGSEGVLCGGFSMATSSTRQGSTTERRMLGRKDQGERGTAADQTNLLPD